MKVHDVTMVTMGATPGLGESEPARTHSWHVKMRSTRGAGAEYP